MTRATQLESWTQIKPTLGDKQYTVLLAIRQSPHGLTLWEIVDNLKWPINSVSGRVTELAAMGKIRDSGGRKVNPRTGKRAVVWVSKEPEQLAFA